MWISNRAESPTIMLQGSDIGAYDADKGGLCGKIDRNVPKKVKRILYVGLLQPILLYGHEAWNISTKNMSKITAAEMKVVRTIHGVTIMDKLRNKDLCKQLKITPIKDVVKANQLRYYGHIKRRESLHPTQLALIYNVEGTRPTGRPRKRWLQYINDYLQERGTTIKSIEQDLRYMDREEWRSLVAYLPEKSTKT